MALQTYNPNHPNASSGWVALTADAPFAGLDREVTIRDTALAVSGGVATTALITLPWAASVMHYGADGGNGTITAGLGLVRWSPLGSSAADAKLPGIASDITSSSGVEPAAPTTVDNTNKMGMLRCPPTRHKVRFTGLAGTSTTISFVAHYVRYRD